ncbi:MAG: transglutaminase-like domain-containing protein [Cytophagales bacterium]
MEEVLDENKLKALVSLLSDEDAEILNHVQEKILSLDAETIIPFLENEWESNFNPEVQRRIEILIHSLQFETLKKRLLAWKMTNQQDLMEGIWLIATYQYPDLELSKLKAELETIFYEVWLEMQNEFSPSDTIKLLNNLFFGKLKFAPNSKNFHSPGNSMINVVLETRKGNPISLCVIYMMIAQKLKLPVYGVNLPNLFILTYKSPEHTFYINVFNKGLIFSKSDIDNYIAQLNISPQPTFYDPCQNIDILVRMLRNLIVAFEKNGEKEKVEEVNELLEVLINSQ